ncbi:MAG TPA: S8 family serine peptidase [Steroidobacteraceae bacterium]|jgi:serine protease|nr:S8 family serine peptidase [Steroidobacteraceae bacterium]
MRPKKNRGLALTLLAWMSGILTVPQWVAAAEFNPVRHAPEAAAVAPTPRIILKLRAPTSVDGADETATTRLDRIGRRTGVNLNLLRSITERMQVLEVAPGQGGAALRATLARLRNDPDVEYATVDERRYAHQAPSDPLFMQQWYLQNDPSTPSAIDAVSAWDTTVGTGSVVIADVDTGVRFDHPDLARAARGGRLLPGYDFIGNEAVANDGDGWDADASDPGDWVTSAESTAAPFKGCTVTNSSWHGTRTAGILGALTNNATGIAGITWGAQILPVRALGKCGGYDSDIQQAMLWAAGVHVNNVPDNPNPARILNMSFGSAGETCPQSYLDVIEQVTALGVVVVASAGNEGGPVDTPANCAGVIAVAGLRQAGTKVGFSSLGPQVGLSAPAGNCVNTTPGSQCLYSILTTTNAGTTVPATNTYTDMFANANLGTSFSAPMVSGIAALMASVNPNLNSCQMAARLKEGAQPFPQISAGETPQPPLCHVPTDANDLQTAECVCTLDGKTCGAGMANARTAVAAALRPIAAIAISASRGTVTLDATGSTAALNHTLTAYQWRTVSGVSVTAQGAGTATASIPLPVCGLATVQLTVTDDAGRNDIATAVLSPNGAVSTAPAAATQRSCSAESAAVEVDVCPASAQVTVGSGTLGFSASAANTSDPVVSWQVNGIPGGNATVGTISSAGVFTAPAVMPATASETITAVADADSTLTASAVVTLSVAGSAATTSTGTHGGGGGFALWSLLLLAAIGVGQRAVLRRARL